MSYAILRRYSGHKGCAVCGEQYPETEVIKKGLTRAQALVHVGRVSSRGVGWYDEAVEEDDESGAASGWEN